jgi:uncharacterized protein YlbG (UPF0298 family)
MVERQQFIVYFDHHNVLKQIKPIVHVTYVSEKLKYAVAFCDKKRFDGMKGQLLKVKGVTQIEPSYLTMDELTFDEFTTVKENHLTK